MKNSFIKKMSQTFLSGILLILPIFLSIYILIWLASGFDQVFQNILQQFSPDYILPKGFGIVVGAVVIYLIGLSTESIIAQWITETIEKFVRKIPIVGSLFEGFKNLADYLNPQKQESKGQTVLVTLPETNSKVIGFMTLTQLDSFPEPLKSSQLVAVYVPMSYMVGGVTLFVEKSRIQILDIPFEKAMTGTLIGWVRKN